MDISVDERNLISRSDFWWSHLMNLISSNEFNEEEIIAMLDSITLSENEIKEIVNRPHEEETMLMWAVWHHKKYVVAKLLRCGANPNYRNPAGENVSTYLSCNHNKRDQLIVFEIAKILHEAGACLHQDSRENYSIVRRAYEYDLKILKEKFKELGYYPTDQGIKLTYAYYKQ